MAAAPSLADRSQPADCALPPHPQGMEAGSRSAESQRRLHTRCSSSKPRQRCPRRSGGRGTAPGQRGAGCRGAPPRPPSPPARALPGPPTLCTAAAGHGQPRPAAQWLPAGGPRPHRLRRRWRWRCPVPWSPAAGATRGAGGRAPPQDATETRAAGRAQPADVGTEGHQCLRFVWLLMVRILLFYTVIEHSVMVPARGCPGSTCISPVWLDRCNTHSLSLSLPYGLAIVWPPVNSVSCLNHCLLVLARLRRESLIPCLGLCSCLYCLIGLSFFVSMHTVSSFGICQGMSWQHLNQPCVAGLV